MSRLRCFGGKPTDPPPPPTLTITGSPPATGVVGNSYSFTPQISGGTAPYTVTLQAGTLPSGTSMNSSTGAVTGTLTTAQTRTGIVQRVTDSGSPAQTADLAWPDVVISASAAPADQTMQIETSQTRWVDVSSFLDTIPDNDISVTVNGPVTLQAWGFYAPQGDGETKTWVKRELANALIADPTGSSAGAPSSWEFSSTDAGGNPVSYVLTFDILSTPVLTMDISSRTYAGMGGFPLSRFGTATDWTIDSQSTSGAFAIWDNEAVAWAGTYFGARTVTSPTVGDAAYTVTVSSASLGVSGAVITFNVRDDIIDIRPSATRDSIVTAPYDQLGKVVRDGDAAGAIHWGDIIISREGTYNAALDRNVEVAVKQPTPATGGPAMPSAPFGDNTTPSFLPTDGWNPGYVTLKSELPNAAHAPRWKLNVSGLSGQEVWHLWWGWDLNKTGSSGGYSIFYEGAGSPNGIIGVAAAHCLDPIFGGNVADYNKMWAMVWNDIDQTRIDYSFMIQMSGRDMVVWGNVYRNMLGDIFNSLNYCDTYGTHNNKNCFNISVHKKLAKGVHSDFMQPNGAGSATTYKNLAADTDLEWGDWIGNLCLKGQGYLYTEDDVNLTSVFVSKTSTVGTFIEGETISNGVGDTMPCTGLTSSSSGVSWTWGSQAFPNIFQVGQTVTGQTSGATATITSVTTWAGGNVTAANVGQTIGDCQGWFANAPSTSPSVSYKSDVNHYYLFAGNMVEGMSSYGFYRLPNPHADTVVANNLVTYPWATISEFGVTGAYYEKGRAYPGGASVAPGSSFVSSVTGLKVVRNVFTNGSGMGASPATVDNLVGSNFGSPTSTTTTVPSQVTAAWNNPSAGSSYADLRDIIDAWTPTVGSALRSQGTAEIFGPFDNGMIDFRRQTYDRTRLTAYA